MELYLQFGFGMMGHCLHLLSEWDGGTVILSPRDLTDEQLTRLSIDVQNLPNGEVLLDPQFYMPHANHERLCSHDFWPSQYDTNVFWQGPELANLIRVLADLNQRLGCREFISPGLLAPAVNSDWLATQQAILEGASSAGLPLCCTIALSADATRSEPQIASLLDRAEHWQRQYRPVTYYVVCEHPNGDYLVEDPSWLANVLDVIAGLRFLGARVILGYCNHQMLIAATAKANAICSGTWMNVRSFPPAKFAPAYEEEIARRATWYYCPDALSEYKAAFLDIAFRQGVLHNMQPAQDLDRTYAAPLFSGALPTSVDFSEQAAFRHYLTCLHGQTSSSEAPTFDETVDHHQCVLTQAEAVLTALRNAGVSGQRRDFTDVVDVNRAALAILTSTRGALLRRRWTSM